jgi:hypothetical protein
METWKAKVGANVAIGTGTIGTTIIIMGMEMERRKKEWQKKMGKRKRRKMMPKMKGWKAKSQMAPGQKVMNDIVQMGVMDSM